MARGQDRFPYLDVPFQHASPRILKLMKRPANAEKHARRASRHGARPARTSRSAARSSPAFPARPKPSSSELLAFLERSAARPRRLLRLLAGRRRGGERAARSGPGRSARGAARALHGKCRRAISAARLARKVGTTLRVLVDEARRRRSRSRARAADAPEIDGIVRVKGGGKLRPGAFADVTVTAADEHDLARVARDTRLRLDGVAPRRRRRVVLPAVPAREPARRREAEQQRDLGAGCACP